MTNIKDVMKVEHVCFYDDVSTKESALLRVALQLKGDGRVSDWDGLWSAIQAREKQSSTVLGHGLALPHARTDLVKSICLALGRFHGGVDFGDGVRVDWVVVAAVPHACTSDYLRIIGSLARVFGTDSNRAQLLATDSPRQFQLLLGRMCEAL